MKKKNNISTNYGKVKGRLSRYDMSGSYNFSENKKSTGNNLVNDLKNYRNEENCNINNYNNSSSAGNINANTNYNGNNNYYSHNYKYNKNSYPYDYNSYQPKKIYEYKEKFKNCNHSNNHNNNFYNNNNNNIVENRNNMSTLNISNKINKENNVEKNEDEDDDGDDEDDYTKEDNKSNEDENLNEEVSLLREKICFKMLKSIDIYITEIIMKSCFVTVYKMKENELKWTRADIEGFLYIVRRSVNPFYRLIITNKKNENHLLQDIDANINLSTDQNYIFYRTLNEENNSKSIYSLWFYSTEEKEKIYSVLKELVERACQEKNHLDKNKSSSNNNRSSNSNNDNNGSSSNNNNYNKNVNFIFAKNSSINDNTTVTTKAEENLKDLNTLYSKNEDIKINKDIDSDNNNSVSNHLLVLKSKQGKENMNNVLKNKKSNNNFTSVKSNSTTDNENDDNLDIVDPNKNNIDCMRLQMSNDKYIKHYYNINNSSSITTNGNVITNKNMNGNLDDLNNNNFSNKKATYGNRNSVNYNDKAGRKLLYLIKGLSTDFDKENENKKLMYDDYEDNENSSDLLNFHKNKIEEKSIHLKNEINAKKGGEAIMSLLGLSKNNEFKEEEEEEKEKKKKKKEKNADTSITTTNNSITNANLKKKEKQILLNSNKDNSNSNSFKYYKNKHDSSDEFSLSNKANRKKKELFNKNSFENCKNINNEKLNSNSKNNNNEEDKITSLLDIIKLKSDKISMNDGNNNNLENDILNSYTDSYNVLLKMQNKIENDDKNIINILDNKAKLKKNNYTDFSDNNEQLKYNNSFEGFNSNKLNNIDHTNKSITLNQNTIHNIIKETLQSDEFIDLLWKKLTMNKNFT